MRNFHDWISEFGLIDIPINNIKFTWSNSREMQSVASLIGFFISHQWWNHFPSASVRGLPRSVSDHCPLLLDADLHKDGPVLSVLKICGYIIIFSRRMSKIGGLKPVLRIGQVYGFRKTFKP